MLVLSRKENEMILFPGLGIKIQVLKVHGQKAKLGVGAPSAIKVLRGELGSVEDDGHWDQYNINGNRNRHAIRNRMNVLRTALSLAEKLVDSNQLSVAEDVLERAITQLDSSVARVAV